ncbi:MAG: YfhO family protein, partial [Paludibacteraceae bacterium]|nr:YfhO family protein [Paludibacteraceae bacterium]
YNPEAMGNAWFVRNIQWVDNPNEEIKAIGDADLKNIAVVDTCWMSRIKQQSFSNTDASVSLVDYHPSRLIYQTNNAANGLLVCSEVYYKTWKAYIDGTEVPLIRANYILRGLEVPAGKHQVELRCVDELYDKSHTWSLIASTLVVVIILGLITLAFFMKRRKQDLQA